MAIFPNLRELFGTPAPAAPLTAAQQATKLQQDQAGASSVSPTTNATVPTTATQQSDGTGPLAIPAAGKGEASPLSEYTKIWETPANPAATAATLASSMTADPEKMLAAARTIDFTKGMDPTMLEAASKGDAGALANLINGAAQNAYAQGAQATVAISKRMLEEQATNFSTKYAPAMLRDASISSAVEKAIPLSQDPAAAPIVAALRTQLSATFPTASADEVTAHVENYLQDFSRRAVESKGGRVTTAADLAVTAARNPLARGEDTDWSKFFGVDPQTMQ